MFFCVSWSVGGGALKQMWHLNGLFLGGKQVAECDRSYMSSSVLPCSVIELQQCGPLLVLQLMLKCGHRVVHTHACSGSLWRHLDLC